MSRACLRSFLLVVAFPIGLQARQTASPTDSLCREEYFSVKGVIADSLTKRPIQGAWIFVNNTSLDTVSGRGGSYRLGRIPKGTHEIVITASGYMPRRVHMSGTLADTIKLLPIRPKSLQEMTARTAGKKWQLFYQRFKEHFIGTSVWADEVKILNPWVIYFEDTDKLKQWRAFADDLILIENMALGYRIRCYLEQLAVEKQVAVFDGCLFFEPMQTLDARTAERWRKNRLAAYRGSLMHFLRRLATAENDSLFKVFRLRGTEYFYHTLNHPDRQINAFADIRKAAEVPYEFIFHFNRDHMQVNYYGAGEDMAYRRFVNRMTKIQRLPERFRASWLASRRESAVFNRLGYFNDPFAVEVYGYWEFQRLAERLPITYNENTAR